MKVSVITPTEDRSKYLMLLQLGLQAQTYADWEWLICDTSLSPLDSLGGANIHYMHSNERLSIGEKRNRLISHATGDLIVHCDDDDYYSPFYLETIVSALKEADLFTIHAWFNFHVNSQQIYYWAADHEGPTHFVVDPITGMSTREINFGPLLACQGAKLMVKGQKGYGFSYAYRKNVAEECIFPDINLGEDQHFFEEAESKGFRVVSLADQKGLVMHVLHDTNTSSVYPQYRVPRFLVEPLFPSFFSSHSYEN